MFNCASFETNFGSFGSFKKTFFFILEFVFALDHYNREYIRELTNKKKWTTFQNDQITPKLMPKEAQLNVLFVPLSCSSKIANCRVENCFFKFLFCSLKRNFKHFRGTFSINEIMEQLECSIALLSTPITGWFYYSKKKLIFFSAHSTYVCLWIYSWTYAPSDRWLFLSRSLAPLRNIRWFCRRHAYYWQTSDQRMQS